jgi:hypothetical protein
MALDGESQVAAEGQPERETFGQEELRKNLQHFTKEELVEMVVKANGQGNKKDWSDYYWAADHELRRLESLLQSEYHTKKELRHAVHVADLESANKQLRREIRMMQETAERRNREVFATGLVVHCTGGCEQGAPFKAEELTEERVEEVERIALRLRSWWMGHLAREKAAGERRRP